MSLILEALRKSEEGKQAPQTPVHFPAFSKVDPGKARPSMSTHLVIVLLLILGSLLAFGIPYRFNTLPSTSPKYVPPDKNSEKQPNHEQSQATDYSAGGYSKAVEPSLPAATHLQVKQVANAQEFESGLVSPDKLSSVKTLSSSTKKIAQSSAPTPTTTANRTQRKESKPKLSAAPKIAPTATPLHLLSTPHIKELSAQIKGQLPTLRYESHWYDKRPEKRNIIINGSNLKEGAQLSNDLSVQSIAKDGCIFNQNGTLFHMRMLESWPPID